MASKSTPANKLIARGRKSLRWWHAAIAVVLVVIVGVIVVRLSHASTDTFTIQADQISGGTLKTKTNGTKAVLLQSGQTAKATITASQAKSSVSLCPYFTVGTNPTSIVFSYTRADGVATVSTERQYVSEDVKSHCIQPLNDTKGGVLRISVKSGQILLYNFYGTTKKVLEFSVNQKVSGPSIASINTVVTMLGDQGLGINIITDPTPSIIFIDGPDKNKSYVFNELSSSNLIEAEQQQYPGETPVCDPRTLNVNGYALGSIFINTTQSAPSSNFTFVRKSALGNYYIYYNDNGLTSDCFTKRSKLNDMQKAQIQMIKDALQTVL